MVMRRKLDRLPASQRDFLIDDLHSAYVSCAMAEEALGTNNLISRKARCIISAIEELAEVLTGDRRFIHRLPFAKKREERSPPCGKNNADSG